MIAAILAFVLVDLGLIAVIAFMAGAAAVLHDDIYGDEL
jgi:hypothetical protein